MPIKLVNLSLTTVFLALAMLPAAAYDTRFADWATVTHPRLGFQIAYPGNLFSPMPGPASEDGQVFVSRDGAKLIVGAFANDGGLTMLDYRTQLLSENYKGADIDYGPFKRGWFVVSGTQGGMHFYERVSFTCEGRLINSWALLYPASMRSFYDRVVDAIARTYLPGAGPSGQCAGL